ncbi:hypothetical protein COP1_006970 [Malus domestica]
MSRRLKLLSLKQDQLGAILWDILEKLWDMSSTILMTKGTISRMMEISEINDEPQTRTQQVDNLVPEPLAPRRSERVSKPPKRYGLDNDFGELHLLGDNDTKEDPRDYTEAMSDIDSKRWQ